MNPVHIDPFAPVDSAQHPANFAQAPEVGSPAEPEPFAFEPDEFAALVAQFPDDLESDLEQTLPVESALQDLLDERQALFGAYATTEEHEAVNGDDEYPPMADLRARHAAHREELIAARPKRDDPKATWVAYYVQVFPQATQEEADALTLPELRDQTRLDGGTE